MAHDCTILILCQGNTCRSPMAEALARRRWKSARVVSKGFEVPNGATVAPEAIAAMEAVELDIVGHVPTQVSDADIERADVIFSLSPRATRWLREQPKAAGKDIREMHVPDPYGSDIEQYRRSAERLARVIARTRLP